MGRKRSKINPYQRKLFLYFVAAALAPLLILGIYSYHSATEALRQSIRQGNETALVQIENQTEKALEVVRMNFMQSAAMDATMAMIDLDYEDVSYPQISAFINSLVGGEGYVYYGKSYSFINLKKGWAVNNKGMQRLSQIKNRDWLETLEQDPRKVFWVNEARDGESMTEEEKLKPEYLTHEYMTLVLKVPTTYSAQTDAMFLVNLNQSYLENLFRESIGNGKLLIFDDAGSLVYSEDENLAAYFQESEHLEGLSGQMQSAVNIGKKQYEIVYSKASVSGWTYLAGYDSQMVSNQMSQIIITMAGLMAVSLAVIGLSSIFGVLRAYRPVRELVTQVRELLPQEVENAQTEEFELINQGLHSLNHSNEELQSMIARQKTQLTELFAFRLIRGRMSEGEIREHMGRLNLSFLPCIYVVSVLFCLRENDSGTEQVEQDVLNLEMMKRLPPEICDILVMPPLIHTHAIVMVIDRENKEKLDEKLLALRNCLLIFADQECGARVNMGVSRMFTDLTHFRTAYHESLEALKINEHSDRDEDTEGISMEDSSITYYADLIHQEGENYARYNLTLDTAVRSAVDSSDQKQAFEITDAFLHEVEKSGVALYEQHYYLQRFLLAILSVPADAGIPVHDLFCEGEDDLFLQFVQLCDFGAVRNFYKRRVIAPVIGRMNQFRKSSSEVVLEKILALVDQKNGDVTLAECAQTLGYHPSYIWRVLKNTKDITFTDYIAQQKLEIARKLLEETELSVAQIAERLSYSNAQNFIRLFKKHMGMTPGQYRKQSREK